MSYDIRYQAKAGKEYYAALKWYRDKSIQTSINFSLTVKECVLLILKQPDRFRKTHKEFREVRLKKFPYKVIYRVDEENKLILIASFFHQKRNPKAKFRNLR